MRDAFRSPVRWVLALLLSGSALAAGTSPPLNYQGLWWRSPPGSESGWGLNLAHQADTIFATWFTYDAGGHAIWLSATAARTGERAYAGALYEASAPGFDSAFDSASVRRVRVGSVRLDFSDADSGTFAYDFRGVAQSKPIARVAFGPPVRCAYSPQAKLAVAGNYTDVWWAGPGESGWGVGIAHQGDVLFATWFTFDRDSSALWLSVTAPRLAPGVYGGELVATAGPSFSATPFDPSLVSRKAAGSAVFAFGGLDTATFTYSLDGVSRTRPLERLPLQPGGATRCGPARAATIVGKVFDGYLEGARVCADVNGNGRCDAGEAVATTDATGAYELGAGTDFDGPLLAEVIAGQARQAGAPVTGSFRMVSPGRDYSVNITPFTTLVQLTGERDFRLAEELVRQELGLPSGFRINLDAAPPGGSLAKVASGAIVAALAATEATLDLASPAALAQVVAAFPPAITELPQLRIATRDQAPINSRETYVQATFTLDYPAASLPRVELKGQIRGRGNTTWALDKKPYKVQITSDAAYAGLGDILGMRKNRNWVLLADHLDRTLMRNKLAFALGNSIFADGLKWTPTGQHVEVWLNGDYVGVYLLAEDIRIDPARLNLRRMSTNPAAGQVDGGYIVEVDVPLDCYKDAIVNLQHTTPQSVHFCLKRPDEADVTPAQIAYIMGLLDETESAIYKRADLRGINPVSFADWYLLNELFRNQDAAFYSSDYMWKDTEAAANPADRLLNMGPIWDFDIAAGNTNMYEGWLTAGCWVNRSRDYMPNWYGKLFDDRDLAVLTITRWRQKRAALGRFVDASIAAFARRLGDAQQRNGARWPGLFTRLWIDYYHFETYGEQVAFLHRYLSERMAWLDWALESPQAFTERCR